MRDFPLEHLGYAADPRTFVAGLFVEHSESDPSMSWGSRPDMRLWQKWFRSLKLCVRTESDPLSALSAKMILKNPELSIFANANGHPLQLSCACPPLQDFEDQSIWSERTHNTCCTSWNRYINAITVSLFSKTKTPLSLLSLSRQLLVIAGHEKRLPLCLRLAFTSFHSFHFVHRDSTMSCEGRWDLQCSANVLCWCHLTKFTRYREIFNEKNPEKLNVANFWHLICVHTQSLFYLENSNLFGGEISKKGAPAGNDIIPPYILPCM